MQIIPMPLFRSIWGDLFKGSGYILRSDQQTDGSFKIFAIRRKKAKELPDKIPLQFIELVAKTAQEKMIIRDIDISLTELCVALFRANHDQFSDVLYGNFCARFYATLNLAFKQVRPGSTCNAEEALSIINLFKNRNV